MKLNVFFQYSPLLETTLSERPNGWDLWTTQFGIRTGRTLFNGTWLVKCNSPCTKNTLSLASGFQNVLPRGIDLPQYHIY